MQQAFAGEAALAKYVLVDLGGGGAVGVDTALPGKQPVVEREILARRQGGGYARLQDAVALHHALARSIDPGLVLGVLGHAHQAAQAARWQLRQWSNLRQPDPSKRSSAPRRPRRRPVRV